MLHVTILMVGKTRQRFIQEGLTFYEKRLRGHLNLTLASVREEKEAPGLTSDIIKAREGERLAAQIPSRAWSVALTPGGKELTSEELAGWLTHRELAGLPVVFLIGGHWGLDAGVLKAAQEQIALSRLTLTHELSRLVLLEQLYRATTIRCGHPYHV